MEYFFALATAALYHFINGGFELTR